MKKFLFALMSLLFVNQVQAVELQNGKQYIELEQAKSIQPEVIEFFSFYCGACYSFEYQYEIPKKIKASLPDGTAFKQYHVVFEEKTERLARAWALAMALGVEDKLKKPLFDAAQKQVLNSMDDIRELFLANGVTAEQFDGGINSFAVTALFNKQVQLAKNFGVQKTPDFYVNGKYQVNSEGLSQHSVEGYITEYVETIKGLLQK